MCFCLWSFEHNYFFSEISFFSLQKLFFFFFLTIFFLFLSMPGINLDAVVKLAELQQEKQTQQIINERLKMAYASEAVRESIKAALPMRSKTPIETLGSMFQYLIGGNTGDAAVDYQILLLRAILIMVGITLAMSITYYIISLAIQLSTKIKQRTLRQRTGGWHASSVKNASVLACDMAPVAEPKMYRNNTNDVPDEGRSPLEYEEWEEEPDVIEEENDQAPPEIVAECILLNKTREMFKPPDGGLLSWKTEDLDGYGVIIELIKMYDRANLCELPLPEKTRVHIRVTRSF
jgi:hypothetical protein